MKTLIRFDPAKDTVTVTCPHCGMQRKGAIRGGRNLQRTLLLHCTCGEYFTLTLNVTTAPTGQTYLEKECAVLEVKDFEAVGTNGDFLTVICPSCARMRQLSPISRRTMSRQLHVNCKCGTLIKVKHDRRKSKRRTTNLLGSYAEESARRTGGPIQIFDLSLHGAGFTALRRHPLVPGDILKLTFDLNDFQNTHIEIGAVVRHVEEDTVGCEFLPGLAADAGVLGFFVFHD